LPYQRKQLLLCWRLVWSSRRKLASPKRLVLLMPFAEDQSIFLADFGLPVVANGVSGLGIYDSPGEYVGDGGVMMLSDPTVRCLGSLVDGLQYGDTITVNGLAYTVRENRPLFDGVWNQVFLTGPIAVTGGTRIITQSGLALITQDGRYLVIQ
jgi:hypothetical protein